MEKSENPIFWVGGTGSKGPLNKRANVQAKVGTTRNLSEKGNELVYYTKSLWGRVAGGRASSLRYVEGFPATLNKN